MNGVTIKKRNREEEEEEENNNYGQELKSHGIIDGRREAC